MTIGIDLSPIQGYHRMRGIGYTLINFINGLPTDVRKKHRFIFYALPFEKSDFGDPLELLNLENMDYEIRPLKAARKISRKLPGRLNMLVSALNNLLEIKDLRFGDSRINSLSGLDAFMQFDQKQAVPRKFGLKKILIIYDIIPYAVEWDYLWSYKTARQIHGFSRKAALRCKVRRWLYIYKIKLNVRRASLLLAISEVTKQEFVSDMKVSPKKIVVTPLGVDLPSKVSGKEASLHQYIKTSWGYRKRDLELDSSVPFILFVGGVDKRRKLADLVTAFNLLRAQGIVMKLVLAGDSMQGPNNIATEEIQHALKSSSYLEDIVFMGFVDDSIRDWLYRNAMAFVFPSRYEGFGLPVLEAMIHKCPVISYKNDATLEVAGTAPLYAENADDIRLSVLKLLAVGQKGLESIGQAGYKQARKYSWSQTARSMIDELGGLD